MTQLPPGLGKISPRAALFEASVRGVSYVLMKRF